VNSFHAAVIVLMVGVFGALPGPAAAEQAPQPGESGYAERAERIHPVHLLRTDTTHAPHPLDYRKEPKCIEI
jgi:hypothetical protein